jgi:hypothetical protein
MRQILRIRGNRQLVSDDAGQRWEQIQGTTPQPEPEPEPEPEPNPSRKPDRKPPPKAPARQKYKA